jgi:two-component system, chemotaxis family, CheB/CheR fusion protein
VTEADSLSHLVVVGSSAGGTEALSELLSTLPDDLPVPVVIAQHLDPERDSHLEEILSRSSPLPVKTVKDEDPLRAGTVFVVSSDRHVSITDSHVGISANSAGRPTPSVDLLMSSAAEVFGERLIAVVLTSTGSDGTEGARAVNRAGGTVVIQDPDTAAFGGMPGSLAPNTVDIVAPLGRIGPLLGDLVTGVKVSEGRTEAEERRELKRFLEELKKRHGIDFRSHKPPTIMRRLKRRMAATGALTVAEYPRHVEENSEEYRQIVNSFLIKATEFFRDPYLFEYLRAEILPGQIEEDVR